MKLELQLDADRVAAGEVVTGRVAVLEGGSSGSLTLTISFCERSPAYEAVVFSDATVVREGELATGVTVDFRYPLPESAPPSVEGKNGELFWELEVRADEPGLDTQARRRFEVVAARP